MVAQALGVMGSMGWVTDPFKKADQLLGLFMVARNSQDPFFKVQASLPWLLQRYEGKPMDLAEKTQEVLENYFRSYYAAANVEVSAYQEDPGQDNKWVLSIRLDLRDDKGRTVSLGKLVGYEGSKIMQIAALNNGSLPTSV